MANEVTEREQSNVPEWMKRASTGTKFGNIDSSDLKPPRLKVLAGQSPEITSGTPGAQVGHFWMTILNIGLGQSVTGSPILLRKSYQLWQPKGIGVSGDQKGPLATASDGIHWDVPNQVFEVKHPNNPRTYKWKIGKLVTEFKMDKFGSSQDDDPKSKPAATLTYDVLWLIDLPNGKKQQCVFTNARTGVTPTRNFISTLMNMGIDQFYQRYRIVTERKMGPTGDPYFTYQYQYIGNIQDEAEGRAVRALFDSYSASGFVVDLEAEADDIRTSQRTEGGPRDFADKQADTDDIPF